MRPEPPPHVLVADSNTGSIWQQTGPGEWVAQGMRAWLATWADLDGGKYGEIELLVPVPYTLGVMPTDQDVAEALLNPVAAMMQQLAAAAGAAVSAVVAGAYQRGRADQQAEAVPHG